ncbi:hypothetical protein [Aquimarina longa]|uniref:hypothetical protein n=1 Tax=Aquimarina longa TaxID=1080221 RepID=UPI0007838552|nr:hypothetical protein [Aquimarina longa]
MKILLSSLFKVFSILLLSTLIFLSCSNDDDHNQTTPKIGLAKLRITTKQCKEPWIGVQGSNLENQVANYLKNLDIELKGFQNDTPSNISSCEACEICAGPTITITVDKKHINRLLDEGFSVVD